MTNIKKLPSEISTEDLLKSLENPEIKEEIIPEAPNNVVSFLLFFKIEPGAFPIKGKILFKLYKKHTKDPVLMNEFYSRINDYLPVKNKVYYINKHALEIGHKTFELLKKSDKVQKFPSYRNHFQNFLKSCGIKNGRNFVLNSEIYEEYRDFCVAIGRQRPIGKKNFNKFLKSYFPTKTAGKQFYIGIKREKQKENKKTNKEV